MRTRTIAPGVDIPVLGLGVYQTDPGVTERVVREAIDVGYRLLDTAQYYRNEDAVGRAVRAAVADGVAREDLFVTTKLYSSGYRAGVRSIEDSLRALDVDVIDLLLIHWPVGDDAGTWRALKEAVGAGRVRAIGLSNFYGRELAEIVQSASIPPAVDQVEQSVRYQQRRLRPVLDAAGIAMESWSPLGSTGASVLREPVLAEIASAHSDQGATPAQVALAFQVATGVLTIPKTTHRERMVENLAAADLVLSEAELARVAALDTGRGSGWPGHAEQDYRPADYPFER